MLQDITTVTVPLDGSAAKSAMIATEELISGSVAPNTLPTHRILLLAIWVLP